VPSSAGSPDNGALPPGDPAISEAELFDILERDYWQDADA